MILGLQLIAIIFSFTMIYFALLHFRRGELNANEIVFWVLIWLVTVLVVVFPELLRTYARRIFITRLFDLMVVGGFVLVIILVAKSYVTSRRTEKTLEDYIRKEALKNIRKEKKKSS